MYAITAGIAANKPNAVAKRASAIPGATALGLLAAIPAVIAYNKFNNDSLKYSQKLENFSKRFLTII